MFCENCGKEIPDEAKFCPLCGAKIQSFQTGNAGQTPDSLPTQDAEKVKSVEPGAEHSEPGKPGAEHSEPGAPHKKRGLTALIIIIIVAAAVVVVLLLNMRYGFLNGRNSSNTEEETAIEEEAETEEEAEAGEEAEAEDEAGAGKDAEDEEEPVAAVVTETSVDPDEYVSVEFDGINGYGTADVTFDFSAMGESYKEDIILTEQAGEDGYLSFSDVLEDAVSVNVSPDSGLSNGDEVTVTLDVDSGTIDGLVNGTVEFLGTELNATVSGLTPVKDFDAFSDVTVTFAGTSPNATASVTVDGGELDEDDYSLDKGSDLQIGDTVTVSIDEKAAKALEEKEGLYPEELSKEYTVEGIDYIVSSIDQIPDEDMDGMMDYAEQVKTDKAESWPKGTHRMNSLEYVGSYLLSEKPGTDESDANILYLVYKLNVTKYGKNEDGSDADITFDYYWYARYTDIEMLEDGTCVVDYDDFYEPDFDTSFTVVTYDYTKEDPEDQKIETGYRGYEDMDSLFEDLIEPMLDDYDCESTVVD